MAGAFRGSTSLIVFHCAEPCLDPRLGFVLAVCVLARGRLGDENRGQDDPRDATGIVRI